MKFAHEMNEAQAAPNLVWLAYSFFTEIEALVCSRSGNLPPGEAMVITADYLVTLLPPVPPPLFCRR